MPKSIVESAALTWAEVYPERRPWNEIEPAAREEWVKVFTCFMWYHQGPATPPERGTQTVRPGNPVFQRQECLFNYCPHQELCEQTCKVPKGTEVQQIN
jgi:hypothetical protein